MARKGHQRTGDEVKVLDHKTVLVSYGPMEMRIQVIERGRSRIDLALEGGDMACRVLEDLAQFLPVIKKRVTELEIRETYPEVVRKMITATKRMEAPDLTPLAAVAGAASDVVADFLRSRGGTKIIVDNGGDIAVRLREEETARVGLKTEIETREPAYVIDLDREMGIGGIATSGLGGRSFTKGIASAATAFSTNAAVADAAATVIGNFSNVDDPNIKRCMAETLYQDTDIPGEWVTQEVGELSKERVEEALQNGLAKARIFCKKGFIKGAL
ncbi:MAG: hypothetical protein A2156_01415, partial [Deltaproteobacteria bacterium RBG_16_48_10]